MEKLKKCPSAYEKFCKKENGKVIVCENGISQIDWKNKEELADHEGFDKNHPTFSATIEKGTVIDRYGDSSGRFASPEGEPYEKRGLPYKHETTEYHRYEVLEPIDCKYGFAAPKFNSEGGARQMAFNDNLETLMAEKKVKEL
jgi:hypothetical protein